VKLLSWNIRHGGIGWRVDLRGKVTSLARAPLNLLETWVASSPDVRAHVQALLDGRGYHFQIRHRTPPKETTIATIRDVLGNPRVAQADWNSPTLSHVSVLLCEWPDGVIDEATRRQLPALAERLAGRSDPTFEVGAHNWVDFGGTVLAALTEGKGPWVYSQPLACDGHHAVHGRP
jgi:hypothetical protein